MNWLNQLFVKTLIFRAGGPRSFFKMALFGLLLLTASCKKDGDAVTPNGGSSLPFVGKNLRMTAVALDPAQDLDGDGRVDGDLMPFLPACSRDNTIRFEKNGQLNGDEGATQCPSTGDGDFVSVEPSTWTYNPQTNVIRVTANGDPSNVTEWEVVNATSNQLKAKVGLASDKGNSLDMVMTWQAI